MATKGAIVIGLLFATLQWMCTATASNSTDLCKDGFDWCKNYSHLCISEPVFRINCPKTCKQCTTDCGECSQTCTVDSRNGSTVCTCFEGYRLQSDGKKCNDIDECLSNACPNTRTPLCQNIPGSYMCKACHAKAGYSKYFGRHDCCVVDNGSQCGKRSNRRSSRRTTKQLWPWVAYIVVGDKLCAGALIANGWVVSAAHCFASINSKQLNKVVIILGTSAQRSADEQTFSATRLIIHPSYAHPSNDIALLRLSKKPVTSSYVNNVCLPNGEAPEPGDTCYSIGYATTRVKGTHPLQDAKLSITEQTECMNALNRSNNGLHSSIVCSRYHKDNECQDLFTGALVCQRCTSCDWYLAGVTLSGRNCATNQNLTTFSKTEHFERWISEQTTIPINKDKACRKTATGEVEEPAIAAFVDVAAEQPVLRPKPTTQQQTTTARVIWSGWNQWTSCSTSCDGGTRQRSRVCGAGLHVQSTCAGEASQNENCNAQPCPIWSRWSEWGACSQTCGVGNTSRSRSCVNGDIGEVGCKIGKNVETKNCNEQSCPSWDAWNQWSSCSKTCGTGESTRKRVCANGNVGDVGCHIGSGVSLKVCNPQPCPFWSQWSEWGACSQTCGAGNSSRSRSCVNGEIGEIGCESGGDSEMQVCNENPCPRWSPWNPSTPCTKTCGKGRLVLSRTCLNGKVGQVGCTGSTEYTATCNTQACPTWSTWTSWSECNASCDGGRQFSSRQCSNGKIGQDGCKGQPVRQKDCNTIHCPAFTKWSSWSSCSASCGSGNETRSRVCSQPGLCPPDQFGIVLVQKRECNSSACAKWSSWGAYTPCSVTCGRGIKIRRRNCEGIGGCYGNATTVSSCKENDCPPPGPCAANSNRLNTASCNTLAALYYCTTFDLFMEANCSATCCALKHGINLPQAGHCQDIYSTSMCLHFQAFCRDSIIRERCQRSCGACSTANHGHRRTKRSLFFNEGNQQP